VGGHRSDQGPGGCVQQVSHAKLCFSIIIFLSSSATVPHEVLPSRETRFALTIWAYGKTKSSLPLPAVGTTKPRAVYPAPLDVSAGLYGDKSIFVSIASYMDSECLPTLKNMYQTASVPERVRVGVVWQHDAASWMSSYRCDDDDNSELSIGKEIDFNSWYGENVLHVEMHYSQATGPCFARHLAESLWRGEEYFLQIDSHMRFRQNWDAYLIRMHFVCIDELKSNRPILTTYPLGYTLPNAVPEDTSATLLVSYNL
jgi:[Skp1-protein]-hydroxyproline N-acetylglucosaminyltransferase